MIKEILGLLRAQVIERRQSSYEADRYMASFLPLLLNAAANDPKLQNSELIRTASDLERLARLRLISQRFFDEESALPLPSESIADPASGSSNFVTNVPEAVKDED